MDTRGRVCSPESLATPNILADDPSAAPLECNVLYKYRAKIRAVDRPIRRVAAWYSGHCYDSYRFFGKRIAYSQ
jgi:hypothetical protein